MHQKIMALLYVFLGWVFVILGLIGALLPILPTTPFLLIALALFAKSSPKFHQMLLNNPWFGKILRDWEQNKAIPKKTKYFAYCIIIASFTMSIILLTGRTHIQIALVALAIIALFFVSRIKVKN